MPARRTDQHRILVLDTVATVLVLGRSPFDAFYAATKTIVTVGPEVFLHGQTVYLITPDGRIEPFQADVHTAPTVSAARTGP